MNALSKARFYAAVKRLFADVRNIGPGDVTVP
jgi:hypothetical protein